MSSLLGSIRGTVQGVHRRHRPRAVVGELAHGRPRPPRTRRAPGLGRAPPPARARRGAGSGRVRRGSPGPGAAGSSISSTVAIGITSRTVEAMKASSAARTSSSVHGRSRDLALLEQPRARDRGEDVVLERRRAEDAAVDPEERPRRALEHAAVGRDEQRLVEAALLREPAREHVARVGERLEAVEDAARREGDRRDPRDRRPLRQRLDDRDPPPAAREDDAQQGVDRAGGLEQGVELGRPARRGRPPGAGPRRSGAAGRSGR